MFTLTACPVVVQCLQRFRLCTADHLVLHCPRILGLYNASHFPLCFPWVCSVPGFWASHDDTTQLKQHGANTNTTQRKTRQYKTTHDIARQGTWHDKRTYHKTTNHRINPTHTLDVKAKLHRLRVLQQSVNE